MPPRETALTHERRPGVRAWRRSWPMAVVASAGAVALLGAALALYVRSAMRHARSSSMTAPATHGSPGR